MYKVSKVSKQDICVARFIMCAIIISEALRWSLRTLGLTWWPGLSQIALRVKYLLHNSL